MKELVVISGKGGTGKTSIAGSFAVLAVNKVLADCDVDASDLHLILQPEVKETHDFIGGKKAIIQPKDCNKCGLCQTVCRFDAIRDYKINSFACEGCGVCYHVCPENAIEFVDHVSGQWFSADTAYGPMIYAQLGIAEENSGKLVSQVRTKARELAQKQHKDLIIIDGPPGVGCPVIATLGGADLVLVVTEPTVSGAHDLKRVIELIEHFKVRALVCINKWDLAEDKCQEIERYCQKQNIDVIGKIPFDPRITEAIIQGVPPVKYTTGGAMETIKVMWDKINTRLVS